MPSLSTHLTLIILMNSIEIAITATLFCGHLQKGKSFWPRAAICATLAAAYACFFPLAQMRQFIHIPTIVIGFIYIGICYQVDLMVTLFYGEAVFLVQCIESVVNTIISTIDPVRFNHYGADAPMTPWSYMLLVCSYAMTLSVIYMLLIRKTHTTELKIKSKAPVLALGAAVLIMNQFWIFNSQISHTSQGSDDVINSIWCLLASVLCLLLQFDIFSSSRKDQELEIINNLMLQKQEQYKTSRSMINAINKKCHQLKIRLGEMSEAGSDSRQINEAIELVNSLDARVDTGNEVLDIIFTEKNLYCLQSKITFVCMIDGEKLNYIDPADLYIIFGNVIDNAIQAVRRLSDTSRRTIYVNVRQDKQFLLIQTENPCDKEPEIVNGWPLGFGMKSVSMVLEKYGGSGNARFSDGNLYLNIILPAQGTEGENDQGGNS